MGNLWGVFLFFLSLGLNPAFAALPQISPEVLDQIRLLSATIKIFEGSHSESKQDQRELKKIIDATKHRNLKEYRELLIRFAQDHGVDPSDGKILRPDEQEQFTRLLIEVYPQETSRYLRTTIAQIRQAMFTLVRFEEKQRGTLASLSPRRNALMQEALTEVGNALIELSNLFRKADPRMMLNYFKHSQLLLLQLTQFFNATLNRYQSVDERAGEIAFSIRNFPGTGKFHYRPEKMNEAFEQERGEETLRIYVNRETATTMALCVALVAEAVTFVAGGSAAMPATLAALTTALRVGSNVMYIGVGSLNISDRILRGESLMQLNTLLDLFLIGSAVGGTVKVFMGTGQVAKGLLAKTAFSWKKQGLKYGIKTGNLLYQFWRITHSEQVAKVENKRGHNKASRDVRRESYAMIAVTLLTGLRQ